MYTLTVTNENGETTSSTRLPEALMSRWRGGDTPAELARGYGIAEEQVIWGLEITAWRESAVRLAFSQREILIGWVGTAVMGYRKFRVEER